MCIASTNWEGDLPGPSIISSPGLVLAEHVAHRAANLAHRAAFLQRLAQDGQQVVGPAGALADLLQPALDQLLVAVGLERVQPLDLLALGLRVDAEDVGHLGIASSTNLLTPTTMSWPIR